MGGVSHRTQEAQQLHHVVVGVRGGSVVARHHAGVAGGAPLRGPAIHAVEGRVLRHTVVQAAALCKVCSPQASC